MSNIILWILQVLMAAGFLYSGICKTVLPPKKLVAIGQTGVEGLSRLSVRIIGILELAGVAGLIVPVYFDIMPWLTPVAAFCLAAIMPFAARIHYQRNELRNVFVNIAYFLIAVLVALGRIWISQ
ncbi:DoxX family protein [Niabella drilacis]|uniref:DoxX-like family protein n=1 Tax=Niabella drilacis (strain DSM 25811 / CCM 8410 / CCUG 62505 / LMG 26954 / E90) TaxID=1285928 RepID=A0A1G6WGN2_NIADE|nr:DoxX family protein [Niabella drilacis]SDD64929.1 DoxX-like family protein [Niabella drilacis]